MRSQSYTCAREFVCNREENGRRERERASIVGTGALLNAHDCGGGGAVCARARVCVHRYAPAADIYVWKGKTPATLTAKVCARAFVHARDVTDPSCSGYGEAHTHRRERVLSCTLARARACVGPP